MKLYPLKLTPVLKNAVWGGKKIPERFGIGEKGKNYAEAWMLTLRPDGVNLIENGPANGMTLEEYKNEVGEKALYGSAGNFPLLIKIIDASDRLSVQVHPDDAYAASHGLDAGRNTGGDQGRGAHGRLRTASQCSKCQKRRLLLHSGWPCSRYRQGNLNCRDSTELQHHLSALRL